MPYETRTLYIPPYNEYEVERRPIMAGHYGEMPQAFISAIKERTGLKDYEFQDYLDLLIVDVFTGWDFRGFILMNIDIVNTAKKRLSRFRTYLAIAMVCLMALPAIIVAVQAATIATTTALASGMGYLSALKLGLEVFAGSLALTFRAFLTAIHFDTLVGVHKIAFLVSEDYRNVMRQVYGEITKVSEALGYGPYFLTLALQNTRNLVLDVSTSMGMRYDLAEVSWLATFQGYMKNFAGAAYKYSNNPEALFFDLSRWVERDALDRKGVFIEGLVRTVEKTTEAVAGAIEQVVVIRDDLSKLVLDLPEAIRSQVEPVIMPYIEKFDTFIIDTYDPYKRELEGIIAKIESLQGSQRSRLTDIVDRLKKPADYLLEIDKLEDWEREEQELKIDYIASSYHRRQLAGVSEVVKPIDAELRKIAEVKTRPLELAFMGVEEVTAPIPIPIGEIDPAKTWFVGEY